MSLLFRNWLEKGFYVEDGYGDLTKTDDINEIAEAKNDGKLYEHDGYSLNKINNEDILNIL